MVEALLAVANFLAEHADIVGLIKDAIEGGVSKDDLMQSIKSEMVKAADAEAHREFES